MNRPSVEDSRLLGNDVKPLGLLDIRRKETRHQLVSPNILDASPRQPDSRENGNLGSADLVIQICPRGISPLNQFNLPWPIPFLERLLPTDGAFHGSIKLSQRVGPSTAKMEGQNAGRHSYQTSLCTRYRFVMYPSTRSFQVDTRWLGCTKRITATACVGHLIRHPSAARVYDQVSGMSRERRVYSQCIERHSACLQGCIRRGGPHASRDK